MNSMKKTYGFKKAKRVFYASKNAGKLSGIDRGFYGHMNASSIKGNRIKGGSYCEKCG